MHDLPYALELHPNDIELNILKIEFLQKESIPSSIHIIHTIYTNIHIRKVQYVIFQLFILIIYVTRSYHKYFFLFCGFVY